MGGFWNALGGFWNALGGFWNALGGFWNALGGFGPLLDRFGRVLDRFGRLLDRFDRLLYSFGRLLDHFGRLLNGFGRLLNGLCGLDACTSSFALANAGQTRSNPASHPQAAVLDEAHRLKGRTSATRAAIESLDVHWRLLLSGTPVQNNMRELQVGWGRGSRACPLAALPNKEGLASV